MQKSKSAEQRAANKQLNTDLISLVVFSKISISLVVFVKINISKVVVVYVKISITNLFTTIFNQQNISPVWLIILLTIFTNKTRVLTK